MAINERLIDTEVAAAADGGAASAEQNLILHLDANDVDSYDGDGDIWYDISEHDVTIPLSSDDSDNLKIHYNPSDTNSYSGTGTTLTNLAGSSLDATVVASRFDIDNGGFFDISTDGEQSIVIPSGHPLNGEFTLEFWFKFHSTPVAGNRFIYDLGETGIQYFYYANLGWRFYQSSGSESDYYGNGSIEVGEWQHKVITLSSSGSFRAYIDGALIDTSDYNTSWTRPTTSLGAFDFGTTDITADKPKCDIGAIRMYDKVLSASEVGQNYRHGRDYIYTELTPDKASFTEGSVTTGAELELDANDYSGSGNWLDSSGNSNDGTISGATYVDDGNSDYFDFDGNDNVSVSHFSELESSARSWEFWVNFDDFSSLKFFGGQYGNSNATNTALFRTAGTGNKFVRASLYDGNGTTTEPTGSIPLTVNQWHHITYVSDNSDNSFKIYVDGVLDVDTNLAFNLNTSNTQDFFLGQGGTFTSFRLNGQIGAFRFYPSALTPQQVQTNYDAIKGLYAYPDLELHLDAGNTDSYDPSSDGSTWSDLAGSNNATMTSMDANQHDKEIGGWFDFDGVNDHAVVSHFSKLESSARTYEFWVNFDSLGTQFFAGTFGGTDATRGFMFRMFGASPQNTIRAQVYSGTGTDSEPTGTKLIEAGKWYHIVFVSDNSDRSFKSYVNGELDINQTLSFDVNTSSTEPFSLGRGGSGYTINRINGKIGQTRFYSSALTADEVMQNYLFTKNDYPNGYNGDFDGLTSSDWNSNGYFDFPVGSDNISLDSFGGIDFNQTLVMWVNLGANTNADSGVYRYYLYSQYTGSNYQYFNVYAYDETDGVKLKFYWRDTSSSYYFTESDVDSVWSSGWNMVAVYIAGTEEVYSSVNGNNWAETTLEFGDLGTEDVIPRGNVLLSNARGNTSTATQRNPFSMSQLKVYDKVLTNSELSALNTAGYQG